MTAAQKAARLKMAIAALLDASEWVGQALGDSDVGEETQERIRELVDDLTLDVVELSN